MELTSDGGVPAWSPGGTKIAFESERSGNWDIWVMNADGTNPVQITTDPAADKRPTWSPDGTKIAFQSNRAGNWDIWVISLVPSESKDVLIIDDTNKLAFFGWRKASWMIPRSSYPTFWTLLQRTIDWAVDFKEPSDTEIALFTYDGDFTTVHSVYEVDAFEVYKYLVDTEYVVTPLHQAEVPTADVTSYDLVIYWHLYGPENCTNIVNQHKPFISTRPQHTDDMNIGTGEGTMQEDRDTFFVVNNGYYPTEILPLGRLTFEGNIRTLATSAFGSGIPLVSVEPPPVADFTYSPESPPVCHDVKFDGSDSYDPDGYIRVSP